MHQFLRSIRYALRGFSVAWRGEQNFRLQTIAGMLVFGAAFALNVRLAEWIVLILLVVLVLVLEIINTVLEKMSDVFKPRLHPAVRDMKDLMASAVLLSSLTALIVGILVFYPYVVRIL